jgi:hypothetical protein
VAATDVGGGEDFQEEGKVAENEGACIYFFYLIYLTLPVTNIVQCPMTGFVNDELETMWKGTVLVCIFA